MTRMAVFAAAVLAGCSGTARGPATVFPSASPTPSASPAAAGSVTPVPTTRPITAADINFMTGMIGHHRQAILMAGWAATHGASPTIQTLASRIIVSQTAGSSASW